MYQVERASRSCLERFPRGTCFVAAFNFAKALNVDIINLCSTLLICILRTNKEAEHKAGVSGFSIKLDIHGLNMRRLGTCVRQDITRGTDWGKGTD